MLNALRHQRNRPFLHVLVFGQLVSLISVLVFSTCAMPSIWRHASAEAQPQSCSESSNHFHAHAGHSQVTTKDCSYKSCLAFQPNPAAEFAFDIPKIPDVILGFIWMTLGLFLYASTQPPPRTNSPPDGQRIPLFHQFCSLLI